MSDSLYWWRPFGTSRDVVVSLAKYGTCWFRLAHLRPSISNFGDVLSRDAIQELLGRRFRWAAPRHADYIGVGSLLNSAVRAGFHGTVLGSGLRRPLPPGQGLGEDVRVLGVRGLLTVEELGLDKAYAIGDPGLLARELYPPRRSEKRHGAPVLIPHFEVFNSSRQLRRLNSFQAEGWRIVPPNSTPLDVAQQVSGASLVATSSLHGYIFANSFSVPAALVSFEDAREPAFKYRDYLSIFNIEPEWTDIRDLYGKGARYMTDNLESSTAAIASKVEEIIERIYRAAKGELGQ